MLCAALAGMLERFERFADRRVLLGVDTVDLERNRVGGDEQAAEQRSERDSASVWCVGDRLDHLGREAHDTERGGTDLRVGRAELLELDVDQRRVGVGDPSFHHRVVATRGTAEHERGTEVVQQARR